MCYMCSDTQALKLFYAGCFVVNYQIICCIKSSRTVRNMRLALALYALNPSAVSGCQTAGNVNGEESPAIPHTI